MSEPTTIFSSDAQAQAVLELRKKAFEDKAARRRYLVSAPIAEKLRILEEMRDLTLALKTTREKNRARIRSAVAASSAK